MKLISTFLVFGALFSTSWADDAAVSGLKIKRLSGSQRPPGNYTAPLDHLNDGRSSFGQSARPVGEQESITLNSPSQHPLGESLVIPKRKPFSDW